MYLGGTRNRADLLLLQLPFAIQLRTRCPGIVLGPSRRAGVPNSQSSRRCNVQVLSHSTSPQARGLVAEDRQQRDTFPLDQLGHQPRHIERGIIPIKLADLEEIRVLRAMSASLPTVVNAMVSRAVGFPVVHAAVEIEVALKAIEKPGTTRL